MQANQKSVIWTTVIATIVILVLGAFAVASVNSNLRSVGDKLDGFDIDEVALGNAITNAVLAGIVIPEVTVPEYDTEKVDDLWQTLFVERINNLKGYVYDEFVEGERTLTLDFLSDYSEEFNLEDAEEYVEDNLADFDEFAIGHELDTYDNEEVGFEIVQMGEYEAFNGITYNEGEDSEVVVTLEYDFRYEDEHTDEEHKDTLYVTVTAEYDGSDLEDLEVAYSL